MYDEFEPRLYHLALLLCAGGRAAAEDSVTRAFVRCYEAWTVGDVPEVLTYARQALVADVLGRGVPGPADDVVDTNPTFEVLEALPLRPRTAIALRYFEDLSYDEIAAMMNVSIGAVKSDVATGLQRMREQSLPPPG